MNLSNKIFLTIFLLTNAQNLNCLDEQETQQQQSIVKESDKKTQSDKKEGKKNLTKQILNELSESAKIMGLSVAAAITYGIINDQVTARICPEYFTEGFHKAMVQNMPDGALKKILLTTKSPTVLGFIWGIIATWWMGAILGIPVTASSRVGNLPKLNYKDLIKPTSVGMLGMFGATFLAGHQGYLRAKGYTPEKLKAFYGSVAAGVPLKAMHEWVIDVFAHQAAYGSGAVMALCLTFYNLIKRKSLKKDIEKKEKAKQS